MKSVHIGHAVDGWPGSQEMKPQRHRKHLMESMGERPRGQGEYTCLRAECFVQIKKYIQLSSRLKKRRRIGDDVYGTINININVQQYINRNVI